MSTWRRRGVGRHIRIPGQGIWQSGANQIVPRTLGNLSGRFNEAISRKEAQLQSKCMVDNGDHALGGAGRPVVDVQGSTQRSRPSCNELLANVDDSHGHGHR